MTSQTSVQIARTRQLLQSGAARRVRLAANLSLAEAGEPVGKTASTVYRWEQGHRMPRGADAVNYGRFIELLAKSLGLSLTESGKEPAA